MTRLVIFGVEAERALLSSDEVRALRNIRHWKTVAPGCRIARRRNVVQIVGHSKYQRFGLLPSLLTLLQRANT